MLFMAFIKKRIVRQYLSNSISILQVFNSFKKIENKQYLLLGLTVSKMN